MRSRTVLDRIRDVWADMHKRCYVTSCHSYPWYGGRGIVVSDEWAEFSAFHDWALEHGYAPGLQIDRVDSDGNYGPDNCRFVTRSENMRNTRRAVYMTAFGKTQTLAAWAEEYNVPYRRLHSRVKRGWDPEQALTATAFEGPNRSLKGAVFNENKRNEKAFG